MIWPPLHEAVEKEVGVFRAVPSSQSVPLVLLLFSSPTSLLCVLLHIQVPPLQANSISRLATLLACRCVLLGG